ncbi:MAG: prolyl oligopeptidase family serine peptidase [Clostridia bacterium]|nr:prolyl oligopeptidase family serine peptidase [Clostridia bacterium]
MDKIISCVDLRNFAYVNDRICKMPVKGIVIEFFGLNGSAMYEEDTEEGRFYAENGILFVIPYTNPWSWMNRQAVLYTDEIIDVIIEKFGLDGNIPIVSTGGSMGGQSALVYSVYAKRTPVCCTANCPVCDLPFHFTERPDLPRTLYSAFFYEDGSVNDVLQTASPIHLAPKMPPIEYHIFHCGEDRAVNISKHSEKFVDEMKKHGQNITFDVVPGRGHCELTEETRGLYREYILKSIFNKTQHK